MILHCSLLKNLSAIQLSYKTDSTKKFNSFFPYKPQRQFVLVKMINMIHNIQSCTQLDTLKYRLKFHGCYHFWLCFHSFCITCQPMFFFLGSSLAAFDLIRYFFAFYGCFWIWVSKTPAGRNNSAAIRKEFWLHD